MNLSHRNHPNPAVTQATEMYRNRNTSTPNQEDGLWILTAQAHLQQFEFNAGSLDI